MFFDPILTLPSDIKKIFFFILTIENNFHMLFLAGTSFSFSRFDKESGNLDFRESRLKWP